MPNLIYYSRRPWTKNEYGNTQVFWIQPVDQFLDPYKHEFDRRGKSSGNGEVHIGQLLRPEESDYGGHGITTVKAYTDRTLEHFYANYNGYSTYTNWSVFETQSGPELTRHFEGIFCQSKFFRNDPMPQFHFLQLTYNAYNNECTVVEEVYWPNVARTAICHKTVRNTKYKPFCPPGMSYADRRKYTHTHCENYVADWKNRMKYFTDKAADGENPALYIPGIPFEDSDVCWEHRYKEHVLLDNFGLMEFDIRCEPVQDMGRALYNAVENIPELDMNNIANIVEALSIAKEITVLIISVVTNGGKGLSKSKTVLKTISSIWLGYRYQWSTTIGDIHSAVDYLDRVMSAIGRDAIMIRGHTEGVEWKCRASASLPMKYVIPPELNTLHDLLHMDQYWMRTYGVALTYENIWDMVPFSFVVDWFLKIGDILGALETRLTALDLDFPEIWYSLTTSYTNNLGYEEQHYVRLRGPAYNGLPKWDHTLSKSGKTWVFRLADVLSIFIGG